MTDTVTQFGRYFRLVVGTPDGNSYLDLSELQCKFFIKRGDTQTPNSLTARVYNVSRETQQSLTAQPTPEFTNVTLLAGYQQNFGLIFSGNIRYVSTGHENATDSFMEIHAADGDSAYNFAFVNKPLAAGSTPTDQIYACIGAMQRTIPQVGGGYKSAALTGSALPRGKVLFGMARDHLAQIAASTNSQWSIQDGFVNFVSQLDVLPTTAVVVNSATGMIGFPEKTIQGVHVRTLLNPAIKINALLQINEADINTFNYPVDNTSNSNPVFANKAFQQLLTAADGLYQVLWVEHFGDTRGTEWYSDIIAVARSADVKFRTNPSKFIIAPDAIVPPSDAQVTVP